MDCPEAIHQLMLDCWQKERAHRPTFSSIVKTLDKLICCPETLRKIAASQAANPLAPDAPDLTRFSSVDDWLASLKMTRYSDNFAAAGVTSMDQVGIDIIDDPYQCQGCNIDIFPGCTTGPQSTCRAWHYSGRSPEEDKHIHSGHQGAAERECQ